MRSPLAAALRQAKITESIPRELHMWFFLHLYWHWFTGVHPIHFCWVGVQLLSRKHSARSLLQQLLSHQWISDSAMNGHEVVSTVQPRLQGSFGLRTGAQPRQSRSPRISRGSCQECSLPVHQKTKVQEDQVKMRYLFFPKDHMFFSTGSSFTVEDTWCSPLPETSTPAQTRFSTFLLIMHGILKSAVCLWWCKMLRSHYNKARGDYFLISIITQSVIISQTNLISKRALRSLMVIFLKWCVGLKSCVWSDSEGDKSSTSISWGLSFLRKGYCALRTDDTGDRSQICCLIWNTLFISGG